MPKVWIGLLLVASVLGVLLVTPARTLEEELEDPRRALREAVERRDHEVALELLEAGVDPARALVWLSKAGDGGGIEWLFANGAAVDGRSAARALVAAINAEHHTVAELLKRHGAEIDGTDDSGVTLLMSAAARGERGRALQRLIQQGANVNAQSLAGRTPLLVAAKSDRPLGVARLLAEGAAVDTADRDGWTPLAVAARNGSRSVVALLLEAGADPNRSSALGWTPLSWAAWHGHTAILRQLLASGADPNLANPVSGPPIIRAVQAGRPNVVAELLAAGARPRERYAGLDAFGWARAAGRTGILRMLRKGGR